MSRKKIILALALAFLLLISFWLGRLTGRESTGGGYSHREVASNSTKSTAASTPHEHAEGEADKHTEKKEEVAGLKLSP